MTRSAPSASTPTSLPGLAFSTVSRRGRRCRSRSSCGRSGGRRRPAPWRGWWSRCTARPGGGRLGRYGGGGGGGRDVVATSAVAILRMFIGTPSRSVVRAALPTALTGGSESPRRPDGSPRGEPGEAEAREGTDGPRDDGDGVDGSVMTARAAAAPVDYAGGMESYAAGETTPALLEETIGANFERTVAAHPGPRGAGRGGHRAALDLGRARPRRRRAGPRADRGRASRRATGSASGRRTAPSGRSSQYATAQGRRDPGQRQPGLPHPRARLRRQPGGMRLLISAPAFKTSDYRGMVERGAPTTARRLERRSSTSTPTTGPRWSPRARRCPRARWRERAATLDPGRPDQHPVHLRHHRLPQGRDAEPPQHPQQRLLHHRADATSPSRTGSASRCPSTTASGW